MQQYQDLAEHIGSLVALTSFLAGVVGFFIWRMMVRLEKKLDDVHQFCCECRPEMLGRFATKLELRDIREELRQSFCRHTHSNDGEVIRLIR